MLIRAFQVQIGRPGQARSDGKHGFVAGALGLSFFSENGGIVDADGDWDMQFAAA